MRRDEPAKARDVPHLVARDVECERVELRVGDRSILARERPDALVEPF